MDTLYREIILEHWKDPQNNGVLEDSNIDITDTNPLCGDEIRITAKIADNKIIEILFISNGCAISTASASIFTETIKGMSIKEIKKITPEEVLDTLEIKLTPSRTKCALLVYTTLQKGLQSYSSMVK